MKQQMRRALGGVALLGLAGVLFHAAGMVPAALRAAATLEPPYEGLDSALAMSGLFCLLIGVGLVVSFFLDIRNARRTRRAMEAEQERRADIASALAGNRQSVVETLREPVGEDVHPSAAKAE